MGIASGTKQHNVNMAQQTAVEWFSKEVAELFFQLLHKKITAGEYAVKYMDLVEQAKQMEKEQITTAYQTDRRPCSDEDAEQYYNETYGKE